MPVTLRALVPPIRGKALTRGKAELTDDGLRVVPVPIEHTEEGPEQNNLEEVAVT